MTLSRRELLEAFLGVPVAASLAAGCGSTRSRDAVSVTLHGQDAARGHTLRDGAIPSETFTRASTMRRRAKVVIVGGGPSGLVAAWRLAARGVRDVVLLELEPELGGTSRGGRNAITRFPWAAHYVPVPLPEHRELVALFEEMGAITHVDANGRPAPAEEALVRDPDERVFFRGRWYPGLYPRAGATHEDLNEYERFRAIVRTFAARRHASGARAFALPIRTSSRDDDLLALDHTSAAAWLDAHGFHTERLRWMLEYACKDDYGATLAQTSAWAFLAYFCARNVGSSEPGDPGGDDGAEYLTWPDGNGAIVRHLADRAERAGFVTHTRTLVAHVRENESHDGAQVHALLGDTPVIFDADHVVVATPSFVARRIAPQVRDAVLDAAPPPYSSWLVANLTLHDRPKSRGFPLAWDNVLYDSPSVGYVCATHQRGRDVGPTVLTYYLPLLSGDAARDRRALLTLEARHARDLILDDLGRAHPDFDACVAHIDVFRWGHAMPRPVPGFLRRVAAGWRERDGDAQRRIHFAHTDRSGIALFEEAFDHALCAADAIASACAPQPAVPT